MTQRKFDWPHFAKITKKRFKKRFKKPIKSKDMKMIWKDFVKHGILNRLIEGGEIKIDKHQSMEIVGTPVLDDKVFFNLLLKGKSIKRNGDIKTADMKSQRKGVKYKIEYKHKLGDVNFKADPWFANHVHEAIIHTSNYYRICPSKN